MNEWVLSNPPVWETALAVLTSAPTVYDCYEIAALHECFHTRFPRAERQPPILGLDLFQAGAPVILNLHPVSFAPSLDLNRWLFTSEDGRNLIQLQENLIGRNWRRIGDAPAPKQSYTNFEALLKDFEGSISTVGDFGRQRGRDMPPPKIVSLCYINHLNQLREDKTVRRIKETISFVRFEDDYPKNAFAMNWAEQIPGAGSTDLFMNISLHFLTTPVVLADGSLAQSPFVRLAFDARGSCTEWSDVRRVATRAHSYMRERLKALTSAELRATWE